MKPLEIEHEIERHPKKIDTWRFLGCSAVCEDGDVCLDFYMGTNPWDHESIFMVVRGGNTPESIADAVWNFFQHYKGRERALVEGRVEWANWFGYQLDAGTIADFLGRDQEVSEEFAALYNDFVVASMKGEDTGSISEQLKQIHPSKCLDTLLKDSLKEAIAYKATCPIITIEVTE